MELYKTHRPKTLADVVGNEQTTQALGSMAKAGKLPHSILFHGPSGCGKTTLARVMATVLGCHEMDVREVNSSSYRGIDSIREIQSTMHNAPSAGKVRVWILDEVHKLSNDAQNAALKMLEDTPKHVYFFLCTTDPDKLIKAVLNRCCEMPVRALPEDECGELLDKVAKKEGIKLTDEDRDNLITAAQGSARLLLVLLDKVAHLDMGQRAEAIQAKLVEQNEAIELCRALIKKERWSVVGAILKNLKGDAESTRWCVLGYARAVLLSKGDWAAYNIIKCFENNFYDSKESGLAAACYEALHAKE